MGKYSWLFKKRDDKNPRGRTCNVVDVEGINYKDFVRHFGKPTNEEKDKWRRHHVWQTHKLRNEQLPSVPRPEIEDIDLLTIQGSIEQITPLKMFLLFEFGLGDMKNLAKKTQWSNI